MTQPATDPAWLRSEGEQLQLGGRWTLAGIAGLDRSLQLQRLARQPQLRIDASAIAAMDTAGAWLLRRTLEALKQAGSEVELQGLAEGQRELLTLVGEVAPFAARQREAGFFERTGRESVRLLTEGYGFLSFVGEASLALLRSLADPRRLRLRALMANLQAAGFHALPIVGLLSFLMGVVIAYQGAVQLERFGANIFIADLVGLAMVRELAPLMTAIIVAGRSGSAFTAQLGTMKVTEEIDALRTLGVPPLELLVLPKILALVIALPLLTVFSDVLGVMGGMLMAKSQLGVSPTDFIERLSHAISLSSFYVGLGKAPVFAAIIALVGCFQGFQVSGSADSVGRQTTVSVVQAIFLVIVVDALFSVLFSWLGI